MRILRAVLALVLGVALIPGRAEAQSPRPLGPISFSLSGGTSKGAFQGGVMYGLLRELHPGNSASPLALEPGHPVAFVGASAGNINAILGALEWCRTTPTEASESLFFQVWRSVGVQALLGESIGDYAVHRRRPEEAGRDRGDDAVLSRAFFRDSLIPMIERRFETTPVRPDCVAPIGLLLNRRRPANLVPNPFQGRVRGEAEGAIEEEDRGCPALWTFDEAPRGNADLPRESRTRVANTRFVSLFGAGVQDDRLTLTSFPFATRDGRAALPPPDVGAWVTPTVDVDEPRAVRSLSVPDAFDIVLASSAFPVAFAPVELRFWAPAHQQDTPSCDGVLCPEQAEFWDGGTFDNAPVLVAHRLGCVARSLRDAAEVPTSPRATPARDSVWVFSLEMNLRRQPVRDEEDADREDLVGVAQLAEVAADFVSAARAYELQATSRFAPDVILQTVSSSRRMQIYGERLSSFGGFLSGALRDVDFYIGVFEGVRFALLERLCTDPGSVDSCLRTGLTRARDRLGVGPCGEVVFDVAYQEEFGEDGDGARLASAARACGHLGALGPQASPVVLAAALSHLLDERRPVCTDRSGALLVLCRAGLLELRRVLLDVAPDGLDLSDDEVLNSLVDEPSELADRLTTIALDRAWRVADWSDSGGPAERSVNALQVVHEATGGRVVEGFELAPGLFPRAESRKLDRTVKLMPSLVRAAWEPGLAGAGLDAVYLLRLGTPALPRLGLDLRPRILAHRDAAPRLKAGVGLTWVLSTFEVSGGWERDVVETDLSTWFLGLRGPIELFSVELRERGHWSFGLADVPGTAYWLLRFVR